MAFIDTHSHINDEAFALDSSEVIARAFESGVKTLFVVGWDIPSSKKAIELANQYEGVFAMVGIHPENLGEDLSSELAQIEELAHEEKVIAIGEIGLDYHWFKEESHRAKQKEWFIAQIRLANKLGLPVCIHARDASADTYDLLKENPIKNGAVLHCYSGSEEMMKEFAKLGLYFGFDGPVTFKNATEPKKCAKACPFDRLLVETDCPYMTPVPYRGKRNEPSYIPHIVEEIAKIRDIPAPVLEKQIEENVSALFHVKHG